MDDLRPALLRKMLVLYPLSMAMMGALLFLPAGTWNYWQGWATLAALYLSSCFIGVYFYRNAPQFLARRMQYQEKEKTQNILVKSLGLLYLVGFMIPGFDRRYGWSSVPPWLSLVCIGVLVLCFVTVFFVFRENPYAARTVEVFDDQRVIDTGPYAIVRHPMYAAIIPMYLALPVALGSWWGLLPFATISIGIIPRTLNEEEVLRRDLPGYSAYCERVRYRLYPGLW